VHDSTKPRRGHVIPAQNHRDYRGRHRHRRRLCTPFRRGGCQRRLDRPALIGLTRSLARDYGPDGVRVNAVCPGWVRTPMADEEMQPLMERYEEDLDAAYRRVTADVPLRRAASPDEIAAVCRFLVSQEASIIAGTTIVADGGFDTKLRRQ
jgi:enoyl-[acyl-carrier-protein] reductase (NADH)